MEETDAVVTGDYAFADSDPRRGCSQPCLDNWTDRDGMPFQAAMPECETLSSGNHTEMARCVTCSKRTVRDPQ
jgi:hypothetical protein